MSIESSGHQLPDEQFDPARFARLLSPGVPLDEQVAILEALNLRLPRGEELASMAWTLLDKCRRVNGVPDGAIDLCGTGGDCSGTFSISTVASFVVAGADIPVVKHEAEPESSEEERS